VFGIRLGPSLRRRDGTPCSGESGTVPPSVGTALHAAGGLREYADSGQAVSRAVPVTPDSRLFWSPKGTYLVAHSLTGFLVLDAGTLASVLSADGGNEIIVEDMSVSPDDTRLAGTDRGGSTSLWDIPTKRKVMVFEGQETRAYTPVFSSDGTLLSVV
jgi:WD40 repeat protein